ncbi:Myb/SANT-like domain-containing protein [Tanacetum coccineum]
MATSNATSRKENWTDQSVLTLCNFLIQHQNNNGRNKAYPWSHLQPEYEKIHNHKFNSKQALKSKYDSMRKQYTLWKQLKHGETGLGWNASTGALACSNDWWDRKIKENPNWGQLFVGLGMDQDTSSEIPNVNLENAEIPNVNHANVEIPNVNMRIDETKRRAHTGVRNSREQKLFQRYLAQQEEKQELIIKILKSMLFGAVKKTYSVSRCMIVINGMVDDALMTDDSPLFYLAMDLFEDAVKRELFMNMRNDSARLKWLQHKQDQGD